jgi:hypothetical protein
MLLGYSRLEVVEEFNYLGSVVTSRTDEQVEMQGWTVASKAFFSLLNIKKFNCINRNENKWKQQTCSVLCNWKLESVQDGGYGPWGILIENS